MSNKLQNIKAVEKMLHGEHKSQTRTTHGFNQTSKSVKRNVGDVWTEKDERTGAIWQFEQRDGFRTKKPANSVTHLIKNVLTAPDKCPCCESSMKGTSEERLNLKMYFIHRKCFNCVVKEETLIRAKGKEAWEEYSRAKMLANAESWFKDADHEVNALREVLKMQFIQNADGNIEEWDMSAFLEKFDTDYEQLKAQIFENLKGGHGKESIA
jgi:hypothetical protein